MKRIFFSIVMGSLLAIPSASALEHLCDRWTVAFDNESSFGPEDASSWTSCYKLQGDTLINGLTYARLLFAEGYNKKSADEWSFGYYGAVRETANAEILFIPKNKNQENLLYAFNAQKDDTFNPYVSEETSTLWLKVIDVSEKEIVLDMYESKDDVEPCHQITWMKGIGMKSGLFMPYDDFTEIGIPFGALLCAFNGDEHIYSTPAGEEKGCEYWLSPSTDVENISKPMSTPGIGILSNGQLFILRDGKTYTVQGAEVK